MASSVTIGAADVSVWTEYLLRKFVPGLKANLLFADYCEPAMIPKGAGHYVARWIVPSMRVGSTSALTDGSSGSATDAVTLTRVVGTLTDYGEWFNLSSLAKETEPSVAMDAYNEIMTYAGAAAIDTLLYNQAKSATNFLHVGDTTIGGATLAAGDALKAKDFPVIANFFRARNAIGFEKLSGDYALFIHPDDEMTLVTDVTTAALSWSEVNKHVPAGFEQLINNHRFVGRLNGVTAMRTTIIGTVTEDILAHVNVALARWGVGWLGLGGKPPRQPEIKYKEPGPQSTNDPLDTNCTLGWKARLAHKILDAGNRALVVYTDA